MSATSGITVSPELSEVFGSAVSSQGVRFIKISIRNESLVHDKSIPPSGSIEDDIDKLKDIVEDAVPAYVLVRLDSPPTDWLAVFYVPDNAKVRDKMLYASTRNNLTKALGSAAFTDSIFATTKDDLTVDAYRKHKAHIAAPKPMSAREKELEEIRAAEAASGSYEGSRARRNHLGQTLGVKWTEEVEHAIEDLGKGEGDQLIVISIDPATETLGLSSVTETTVDSLGSSLPHSEPCFAIYAWSHSLTTPPRREIVYIYSCPSSSPVKNRMLYSCSSVVFFKSVGTLLEGTQSTITSRKVETSDPKELNEDYLKLELGFGTRSEAQSGTTTPVGEDEKKSFARPRGPARKR